MSLVLITFPSATGSIVLVNYATKIFVEADSSMSPILSSIIVSLIQLIGAYIATFLVEKVGRKVRKKMQFLPKQISSIKFK